MPSLVERLALAAVHTAEKAEHPSQEPYVEYGDLRAVLIDGTVDMCAVAEAVIRKLVEELNYKRDAQDWMAEYGESEAAAVAASQTDDLIALIEDFLGQ